MRPKRLEIEGLQSFREPQSIDFDSLGETGLFGIFGPTGSGKSTILDAITFVLYGKVKRAERGTQGIINTGRKTVTVSFTFELLKDNTRKTYRVERTYQRKRGSESSCEPKIARLIEITPVGEIPLCDKATEVSSSIEALLGLNHDDYTRAVVLPQNSFQEFLLLDNAKKREMLERIFYLEEYGGRLNEKLAAKIALLQSSIDKVGGALSVLQDASVEALTAAETALHTAHREKDEAETTLKQLEASYNEAKEVWQLVQSFTEIEQKEQQHLLHEEETGRKRIRLDMAVKADGLLELITKTKTLSQQLAATSGRLDEAAVQLPLVADELTNKRRLLNELKAEADEERPKLLTRKTRLTIALETKTELDKLQRKMDELTLAGAQLQKQIDAGNAAVNKERGEAAAAEQKIETFKGQMEPLKTDLQYRQRVQEGVKLEDEVGSKKGYLTELHKKSDSLKAILNSGEKKLHAANAQILGGERAVEALKTEQQELEAAKPAERQVVQQFREEINKLQAILEVLKEKQAGLAGLQGKSQKLQDLAIQHRETLDLREGERRAAEILSAECRRQWEAALQAVQKHTAYRLARDLREGEPCPVCGSDRHPSPALPGGDTPPELLEQELERGEKKLKEAEQLLKERERDCLVVSGQFKNAEEQIIQLGEELAAKQAEYRDAAAKLPEDLRSFTLPQLESELGDMERANTQKLQALEAWEKEAETLHSNLQRLQEQLAAYRMEQNGILSELKVNRENKTQFESELQQAVVTFNAVMEQYGLFLEELKIESAAGELKRLARNDQMLNTLQKEMEQTQALLGGKRALIEQLNEELRQLGGKKIQIDTECANFSSRKGETELKLRELAGDADDIEQEIKRIDQQLAAYLRREKEYGAELEELEARHNQLSSQKVSLEKEKQILTDNLESEHRQLNAALSAKGFSDIAAVESAAIPAAGQKALSAEIRSYDETAAALRAEKAAVVRKLDSRYLTAEEWQQISSAFQEKRAERDRCVSRHTVAENTYQTIKARHEQWLELNRTHGELTHKHGLFEQIQKLLRAEKGKDNSFIDYVAEERLRYVAARASETLGLITKHKYALELDTEAGFIIRDNMNGGVHRMVTTLSGGETFLTSLSLALALSEQIQLKGQSPLEFFFLDEGFGTLDPNLLDLVVDSLERLSSRERVIGLISHVPEMRGRMARRLIVDPPSFQGDGSKVRLERA